METVQAKLSRAINEGELAVDMNDMFNVPE